MKMCQSQYPITSVMTVLEWADTLFESLTPTPDLARTIGNLLETILLHNDKNRSRVVFSAVRKTRSAIACAAPNIDSILDQLLSIIEMDKTLSSLLFFATAAGAASSSLGSFPKLSNAIDTHKEHALAVYISTILGSKSTLTKSLTAALEPLFNDFTTQNDFDSLLVPAIAKSLLRAPEVVLVHSVPGLIKALPPIIDLSQSTLDVLASSLIGCISSSKKQVSQGASSVLGLVLDHCLDATMVEKISLNLIASLKKVSSPDQRALYGDVLQHSKYPSWNTCQNILPFALKEINPVTLKSLSRALFVHLMEALRSSPHLLPENRALLNDITKGFKDKRHNMRSIWLCELAEVVLDYKSSDDALIQVLDVFKPSILEAYRQIAANTNAAAQNKSLSGGYAYLCLSAVFSSLSTDDTVLISSTAFQKLSETADFSWAVRGFAASYRDSPVWYDAWIFFLSKKIPVLSKRLAFSTLRDMYAENPLIGPGLISSLYKNLGLSAAASSDIDFTLVINIFNQVLTRDKNSQVEKNLIGLLIACHHPCIKMKSGWIGLCLKCEIDPFSLVKSHISEVIEEINDSVGLPVYEAVATLTFVNPQAFVPKLLDLLDDLLSVHPVSLENLNIWHTPPGQLAVEESSKKYVENKNSRDYETKKWEESVRREVVAKKGDKHQKLTKEQQAQLAHQDEIRQSVQKIFDKHVRGFGFVMTLAKQQVDDGVEQWFPLSTKKILDLIVLSKPLVGVQAAECFLSLSNRISFRLEASARYLLGIATLRVFANEYVEPHFQIEPLAQLITRLLYKIKFLADQVPFDQVTLEYVLPLIQKTISGTGGIGTKDEEEVNEQVMLALDIVGIHADQFLPSDSRLELIKSLVLQMSSHITMAKQIKESLIRLLQSVSINYTKEELQVIMDAILSNDVFVRTTILEVLDSEFDISEIHYSNQVWISCFDEEQINRDLANTIWEENGLKLDETRIDELIHFIASPYQVIRNSSSLALVAALTKYSNQFGLYFDHLIKLYIEKTQPPPTIYDRFGIIVKSSGDEQWHTRDGIATTLTHLANQFDSKTVITIFNFLISHGLRDENSTVRSKMQKAGIQAINFCGENNIEQLIPIFESYLAIPDSEADDHVSESVIIFYGALARHLTSNDERLLKIIERLISTLDTPSEDVQIAVSECLPPLVPLFLPKLQGYIDYTLNRLFTAEKFGERRGAAYGLAGLVKGAGISALADYDIIRSLMEALEDKKNPLKRQGGQFAIECLSHSLGTYFEPYAIEMVPLILSCLGDTSPEVREATSYAARAIMKNTTGYGIKKLIPLTLENLDTTAWRAKKGSVDLLGTMAYLDPRQLSSSLSTIIPEIVSVMNDTHKEVRNSANQSLKRFGEVITNPEIQTLVPILVRAIGDPTKHTEEALDGLIKTSFIHYIDGPSLALIVHVVHRGLRDRSASTKRKACQIVGNMSILTDSNDLIPYLSKLVSELETAMVDPVPGTRATASKALGSLVEKLGEERFPDLIPRLMDVLKDPVRAGDRMGSAQALSEVMYGLGLLKLEELLPTILSYCVSSKPWIREGFMPLLLYLPACFGPSLSPYLKKIIPTVLSGLADPVEGVRSTALKAGRRIVKNYASKALDLLLPELERGLSDINHRIRLSSVELTGDLLYQITGVSKNVDDSVVSGQVNKQLLEILGAERRDRILALLFICRSDTSGLVRNSALEVWKSLVANTPRTVKDILPSLTQLIIKRLASTEEEHRTIAAQTLGELVRRVGGNALAQLLPTLESLISSDSDTKQGICIALVELVQSTDPEIFSEYKSGVVSIVRRALVDSDPNVREAAGHAFDALQETQDDAIEGILPQLITLMESGDESALDALKEMMSTNSDAVFPVLIPILLKPPMTKFKATSLGSLATVSGTALYKRLSTILNVLVDSLCHNGDETEDVSAALDSIILSVTDDDGVHILMQHLLLLARNEDVKKREITLEHMPIFFEKTHLDYSNFVTDWVTLLVAALDENEKSVVKGAFNSLVSLVKRLSKEELEQLAKPVRQALSSVGSPGTNLAGFDLPRGPSCVLPIFFQALMYGTSEQREHATFGIAEVVLRTSSENLKPFVTQITGPLIRTIGERFPSDVKAAILYTLNILLEKIPNLLKPFLPQLQRTFAKSLSDPSNEVVRSRAAKALGTLITLQTRIDPLVNELVSGARLSDEGVVRAMLQALYEIVDKAGANLSPASKTLLVGLVTSLQTDGKHLVILSKILGGLVKYEDNEKMIRLLKQALHGEFNTDFTVLFFNSVLKFSSGKIVELGFQMELLQYFLKHMGEDSHDFIAENSVLGLGKYVMTFEETDEEQEKEIFVTLGEACTKSPSRSTDTRRFALIIIRLLSHNNRLRLIRNMNYFMLPLFSCVRDQVIPVKLAGEKAYIGLLDLVDNPESKIFEEWFSQAINDGVIPQQSQRSISDYTKRVSVKLANAERERIEAGGDDETVYSDRIEDETELWSIGGV